MREIDVERLLMPNTYVRQLAQELGSSDALVRGSGIRADELEDLDRPITVRQHLHLLGNALGLVNAPDWHLKWGQRMGEHFHGPVSMAWMSAPTLGDGFDTFLRFMPGRVPYLHWQGYREVQQYVAEVAPLLRFGPLAAILVEVPMIVMHEYARTIRPGTLAEARIELMHPAPRNASDYSHWFHCPVRFGADRNALVFPFRWRQQSNVGFDPSLWDAAIARCQSACAVSEERDTLGKVREVLFSEIERHDIDGFAPTLEQMADRLHCSPRTLIRRLKAMNTRYHDVVDKVKKQRACELLANEHLRIHEIGSALGYRDAGSFVRSFKRCLGVTPGQYRQQLTETNRRPALGRTIS